MNRFVAIWFLGVALFFSGVGLESCDDGNIEEELNFSVKEGLVVKLTGGLKNMEQWNSEKYQIVVAAFAAKDSYPLLAKSLPIQADSQDFLFEGISPSCETIELCILNLINKRVATLKTLYERSDEVSLDAKDTIYYHSDGLDVGMFPCIQSAIFTKRCAYCHGMGETPAAGLYLTEGNSYAALVNVPSKKLDSLKRVLPYDASHSMLYKVLTEYGEGCGWHYDHTKFFYGNTMSNLVKEWIESGAEQ